MERHSQIIVCRFCIEHIRPLLSTRDFNLRLHKALVNDSNVTQCRNFIDDGAELDCGSAARASLRIEEIRPDEAQNELFNVMGWGMALPRSISA